MFTPKIMNIQGGKLILILVVIIVILQLIHLILLNKLESQSKRKAKAFSEQVNFLDLTGKEVEPFFYNLSSKLEHEKILDSSGEYQIISNIAAPEKKLTTQDITLVTQCSYNHLYNLPTLISHWQGPLSIAVYAENEDLQEALWAIADLLACFSIIKKYVHFNFVFPLPSKSRFMNTVFPSFVMRQPCKLNKSSEKNYSKIKNYPNNLLRNVARKSAETDFIFVLDIDMLPSSKLREDFLLLASKKGLFQKYNQFEKSVFVVPAFEIKLNNTSPLNKTQLLKCLDSGVARPFYIEVCHKCQVPTNYKEWQKAGPTSELSLLFEILWKDPWEPFYISFKNVPFYDERFKQYGFNRISQACELHIAGYTFFVLNNAFLVHQGWKMANSFHADKDYALEQNRILFRQFKQELKLKYPESSRRCY